MAAEGEVVNGDLAFTLPAEVLEAIAEQLAPRIVAQLDGRLPATAAEYGEPWRLLTLKEAAARLGRSERWVRERKEQIGYVRLDGGALAFDVEDLQAFARERRVGGRST